MVVLSGCSVASNSDGCLSLVSALPLPRGVTTLVPAIRAQQIAGGGNMSRCAGKSWEHQQLAVLPDGMSFFWGGRAVALHLPLFLFASGSVRVSSDAASASGNEG
jgi:hypothetical protein